MSAARLRPEKIEHGEANEGVIFIGSFDGFVGSIDPLHCQLQPFTAAHGAKFWGYCINLFRIHTGSGKEGIFRLGLEERKVWHNITLFNI